MDKPTMPAPPQDAATVILARDRPSGGIDILMVERHRDIAFAGGALVFPGGKVTRLDHSARLKRLCLRASAMHSHLLPFKAAAVRELFEETGLLLGRRTAGGEIRETVRRRLAVRHQKRVEAEDIGLHQLLGYAGLKLDSQALTPIARWITPVNSPKRYDTLFFLARAPKGQAAMHDGRELVHTVWAAPETILKWGEAGKYSLMFPTRLNLERLKAARSVSHALSLARNWPLHPVLPQLFRENGVLKARIPVEAGYGGAVFERVLD